MEYLKGFIWSLVAIFIGGMIATVEAATKHNDLYYMAEAIYFESRDQAIVGQVAVGCTILNRVIKKNWPNSVEKVVHQYKQFSYYSDGKPEVYNDEKARYIAWAVSEKVLNSNICDMFDGVDHYLNKSLSPAIWYKSMEFIIEVGDHAFYKRDSK